MFINPYKLFIDISNNVHDASGIDNPNLYYWCLINGVYYPEKKLTETDYHEEVINFIDKFNLPEYSLFEIPIELFNTRELIKYRKFFLNIYNNISELYETN